MPWCFPPTSPHPFHEPFPCFDNGGRQSFSQPKSWPLPCLIDENTSQHTQVVIRRRRQGKDRLLTRQKCPCRMVCYATRHLMPSEKSHGWTTVGSHTSSYTKPCFSLFLCWENLGLTGGKWSITKAKEWLEILLLACWAACLVANSARSFCLPFKSTITQVNHILGSRNTRSKDNTS
jgi:hypothetical protein